MKSPWIILLATCALSQFNCLSPVFSEEKSAGSNRFEASAPSEVAQRNDNAELEKLPLKRSISLKDLSTDKSITINAVWKGKEQKYTGVPLRTFFKEMVSIPIENMADWKQLSRYELVVEVVGKDGYPALISASEMAMNEKGNKFVLCKTNEGKEDSILLVCKDDDYRVRCVRDVAYLRIITLSRGKAE